MEDYILIGSIVLAIIGIFSHIIIFIATKGMYFQLLKSIVSTEGAWFLYFNKNRRIKLTFLSKVPEPKEGTAEKVALGVPLDYMEFDGKPAFVGVEGTPENIDIQKKHPYSQNTEMIISMIKLAFKTGFTKGLIGLQNFVQENKLILIGIAVAALFGLASAYLIYTQVVPTLESIKAGVVALQAANTAIGIVPSG